MDPILVQPSTYTGMTFAICIAIFLLATITLAAVILRGDTLVSASKSHTDEIAWIKRQMEKESERATTRHDFLRRVVETQAQVSSEADAELKTAVTVAQIRQLQEARLCVREAVELLSETSWQVSAGRSHAHRLVLCAGDLLYAVTNAMPAEIIEAAAKPDQSPGYVPVAPSLRR